MSGKKENMFGSFEAAIEEREQEQKRAEAAVTGQREIPPIRKRGPGATTMTLTISREDKQLVKTYAARQCTTVSDLLHLWIREHCREQEIPPVVR